MSPSRTCERPELVGRQVIAEKPSDEVVGELVVGGIDRRVGREDALRADGVDVVAQDA